MPVYTCDLNLRRYVFEDAHQGLVDVRIKRDLEYFLRTPAVYELAYERHGVTFDEQGQQVDITSSPPVLISTLALTDDELPTEAPGSSNVTVTPPPATHRNKKRR